MIRPVLTLAALGVAGIVVWKLLWVFVLPLIAVAMGLLMTALKIGLIVFVIWLLFRLLRKATREAEAA